MKTNTRETYDPFDYQRRGGKPHNPPTNTNGSYDPFPQNKPTLPKNNTNGSYDPFDYQHPGGKPEHRN
ncbi:hypothetical protein [Rickettsiella endosymbiont of Rhagonycha lignosa]|uniref:hypothetical protein n=1 Tax=Rickettsiella endosymbiont of Rhagonycha lignosa TaxID=3077937 RepID=UPI00313E8B61